MRRPCQYCTRPLSRWARVLHIWSCSNCAYRMSMGTPPLRPPATTDPAAPAK